MFHVLYGLHNCIFEIPDLDCDVNDPVIEFQFGTDKLGLKNKESRLLAGNNPFVKGVFPIEMPVFPSTYRA